MVKFFDFFRVISGAAALTGMSIAASAQAATATTTFLVTTTVLKSCNIVALPLAFGNYDPTLATPNNASTTLTVLCTLGTSFTVGLNAGVTGVAVTARKMANGGSTLNYGLYQDTSHSINWGNTPGTDTPAAIIAPALATVLNVYGQIPAIQNAPALLYTDTITATVNY